MGLLDKFTKKLGGSSGEDIDIEEYLDTLGIEEEDFLEEEANMWIKAVNLQETGDAEAVIQEVRNNVIVLLNIEPLYKRNAIKLKQAISDIKSAVSAINGDIVRISEYRLLVTPSGIKFARTPKKKPTA